MTTQQIPVSEFRDKLRHYLEQVYFERTCLILARHGEDLVAVLPLAEYRRLLAIQTGADSKVE